MLLVTDAGEERKVPVSSLDVKCGAETGDLVEFSLGSSTDGHGQVIFCSCC